jgi:uncharacterized protein
MDILIVDGYNVIGAATKWHSIKEMDLETARDDLIDKLANYKGYKGVRVIVVFDAHLSPGVEKRKQQNKVEVLFTKENETADECIERLAISLRGKRTQIYVATSDFTEQWAIFGQGALRISARELLQEFKLIENQINKTLQKKNQRKQNVKIQLSSEIAEKFEKWRRGDR